MPTKSILSAFKKAPKGKKIRFTGASLIYGDAPLALIKGDVVINGDSIVYAGECLPSKAYADYLAIDAEDFLIIPGLINSHTHAPMGFFRDLGFGHEDMIEKFLFPAEKNLKPKDTRPLSYSYLYDGLLSGVTCFVDHYYFSAGVGDALTQMGLRGVIGETVADLGGAFPSKDIWPKVKKQIESWTHSRLVTPCLAPHAADTVSGKLLKEMADYATKNNLSLHMHLSQSKGEKQRVMAREGISPVEFAERCGALAPQTLATHLISADQKDLKILKKNEVTANFCPVSQIIYEHIAPLQAFLKAGLPLALGTDCAASNDSADMLNEMRIALLLARHMGQKASLDLVRAIWRMATINPAIALGLDQEIGSIQEGKKADLVFLAKSLLGDPVQDPLLNAIMSMGSRQVRHVMIDGKWILYNRDLQTCSLKELRTDYQRAVSAIRKKAQLGHFK